MLACTMTNYEFIISAENKWIYLESSISSASMKSRYEDYQKMMQNLFKSGVVKKNYYFSEA